MEYCETAVDRYTLMTLGDLLLHYSNDLPQQLRIVALCDVSEGLIHGDIKLHNVLVAGSDQEFIFDYACVMNINNIQMPSQSLSLKQLITPGYVAPELINDMGFI